MQTVVLCVCLCCTGGGEKNAGHGQRPAPAPPVEQEPVQPEPAAQADTFAVAGNDTTAPVDTAPAKQIDTLRIRPTEFSGDIPANIAAWLEERGYYIPQSTWKYPAYPSGVTRGSFLRAGRQDWAVLTTDRDSMRLLVFPMGETDTMMTVHSEKIENFWHTWEWMDTDTVAICGYDLYSADAEYILKCQRYHENPDHPEITHDGISLIFNTVSTIFYFNGAEWFPLPGAD